MAIAFHVPGRGLKRWLTSAPTPQVTAGQLLPLAVLAGGFATDADDPDDLDR